ncbi:4-alpha-glucanotransferase [Sphingobium sp. SCG-1]|uniref:4-alpha-glucanotransferase n=1 Tax=Sphingobium sp. SCG-1 TaxID=2072936 RepID=UPI000CD68304|nr:4-alpha-glucanotransferase [Sphingobium sp. SCG-1]AUW58422.1 4-alpha-glucanotransferase [Sphingobium sp. SCG-1]
MSNLHALATAAGLQIDWEDALGEPQRVADEDLALVLNALGFPATDERAIADSRRRLAEDGGGTGGFISADVGRPVDLPLSFGAAGLGELILENGSRRDVRIEQSGAGLSLPPIDTPGYHHLHVNGREIALAIAPSHCFRVEDAASGRKIWGPAVQIPALRDERRQAYGDFGTLAHAAKAFAARGADAIAISPVHALFPADASRYSPYAPSSRLFLNVLYADPALIGEPLLPESGAELIEWETMIPRRLEQMLAIYQRTSGQVRDAVAAFRREQGSDLEAHATFDALHAHFFSSGATGWQDWPAQFHDPSGHAVREFAAGNAEQIGFYAFLQWLAKKGLDAAQEIAVDSGMAVGLIADLAVGMDPGGSHVWSRPQDVLSGLTIGAPPDLLGPDGQNWGITGFSPHALQRTGFEGYIATLRAALGSAGGIRIDHALGLRRLWVVPEGAPASRGAYLTFPMEDMLRILALESQRSKAIVIGEDLGTVPEGLRPAMDERAMLGMRVLWFERDKEGSFVPPSSWPGDAAAMTGTHDLPTVAGWWSGRDIDWTWKLGRTSRAVDEAADRANRAEEREILWKAFEEAGLVDGPQPEPEDTAAVIDAGVAYVGRTPSILAILPMEDIVGLEEQPNLPGTIDEHPNWRRRMPGETDALLNDSPVAARIDLLNKARRS